MFFKIGVLKNFAKFTGKPLCQSLPFNKFAVLRSAILLKKTPWHSCFPVNFEKFLRTFFYRTAASLYYDKKHFWKFPEKRGRESLLASKLFWEFLKFS